MLKRRIDKLEKSLKVMKINQKNVEDIYKYFLTGDKNYIPHSPDLREVYLAASRVKDIELTKCKGLSQVYQILHEEKIVSSQCSLVEYLKTKEYPDTITVTLHDEEELSEPYELMQRLRLFSILAIIVIHTSKFRQNQT